MGANSKIEWTDASWNPIRARNLKTGKVGWHCEHATTGCEFCYAEGFNKRLGTGLPFKPGHRKDVEIFLDEEMLTLPLRWKKPRMIFVCSMTDLFADFVTDNLIDKMFAVMALSPQHTFQVLTKRAARMRDYFADEHQHLRFAQAGGRLMEDGDNTVDTLLYEQYPLPNVWLGVSTERQQEADERIPELLRTPAAIRFISYEPALGPLDIDRWLYIAWQCSRCEHLFAGSHKPVCPECGQIGGWTGSHAFNPPRGQVGPGLDWVIVGGESGPKARPMHPDWPRSLHRQCDAAGVEFFFKQWGRWSPTHPDFPTIVPYAIANDGTVYFSPDIAYPDGPRYGEALRAGHDRAHLTSMYPIGKDKAGRLLDGIEHNGFPA